MYWYRGHLSQNSTVKLPLTNPGLLFGATVFTTLRVYHQSLEHPLTAWQAHCDRLQSSMTAFQWSSPDWTQLRTGAEHLLTHYPVLRITLFPDGTELITGRSLPPDLNHLQQNGITAWLDDQATFFRPLPGHKTGNYLPCWQALQTAQHYGAQEAIFVDSATGTWLETTSGNLWGWANGCWWTPPLSIATLRTFASSPDNSADDSPNHSPEKSSEAWMSHGSLNYEKPLTKPRQQLQILPGIVRSHLIHWLKCQNREIKEEPWTLQFLSTLEALAYCNSVKQVVPIHTVLTSQGKRHYDARHPSFQELFEPFRSQSH